MPGRSEFGRFIRKCRTDLGFSLREVARLSEEDAAFDRITPGNLAMIEKGRHIPSFGKVLTLARIFNVPLHHFQEKYWISAEDKPSTQCGRPPAESLEKAWEHLLEGCCTLALYSFKAVINGQGADKAHRGLLQQARFGMAVCRYQQGQYYAAREELEQLLAEAGTPSELKGRAGLVLARLHQANDNIVLAELHAKSALGWARSNDLRAELLLVAGQAAMERADLPAAQTLFNHVLRINTTQPGIQGAACRSLALCMRELGDLERAREWTEKSMEIAARQGSACEAVQAQLDMASLLTRMGKLREARPLAQGCLIAARELGDEAVVADSLEVLLVIAGAQGDALRQKEYARSIKLLRNQYAPRKRTTAGMVRNMISRSNRRDQFSI